MKPPKSNPSIIAIKELGDLPKHDHLPAPRKRDKKNQINPYLSRWSEAAAIWLRMEDGDLGPVKSWKYPPCNQSKVSYLEIIYRLTGEEQERKHLTCEHPYFWVRSIQFKEYVEVCRAYRDAMRFSQDYNLTKFLDFVVLRGIRELTAQMLMAEAGLAPEIPVKTLLDKLPSWIRLRGEFSGELENSSGISYNFIVQHVENIEDPKERQRILQRMSRRLSDTAKDLGVAKGVLEEHASYHPKVRGIPFGKHNVDTPKDSESEVIDIEPADESD